ncbi:hypothetical protein [Runella sp.]|jgi:plasmid maintenance system antidote protein VapI|uniref:hypothetical protein n=1 Tax=Runella sp. TaxID=1960881 RepID=UPI002611BAD8|nr:hypothetical protein [Runella sp.]
MEIVEGLGVTCANLWTTVNGRAGISSEMAVKLTEAFGNTPELAEELRTLVRRLVYAATSQ